MASEAQNSVEPRRPKPQVLAIRQPVARGTIFEGAVSTDERELT